MINYTPQNQLSLDLFKHPFEKQLDRENRWVKLAALIPWDKMASVYSEKLDSKAGRKSVNIRVVLAALIIKHKLKLDDRGTIMMIQENIYLQYFCGLPEFTMKRVFDPSLFVDIRKRMGGLEFDKLNQYVIEQSESIKPHQARIKKSGSDKEAGDTHDDEGEAPKNKGRLKVDATVADQEMKYPTDLNLLNISRENLERMIDLLYDKELDGEKPRTYRRKARKQYLNLAKKKRKGRKAIRKGIKEQLQYVRRDLKHVDALLAKADRKSKLSRRDSELLETIRKLYEQQKWMYDNNKRSCPDRIVSIFQPQVRPIVRGKDKNKTEFGAKINISEVEGFCRIDRFSWDAYNESVDVKMQVEKFRKLYGCYPKVFLADRIYLTRENRSYLKSKGIKIYGKPLGRPPKKDKSASQKYRDKKEAAKRNHVEGKFGQGKRGYGMNNIKARLASTSESWINAIIFVMNLTKLMKVAEKYGYFFVPFLTRLKMTVKWQFYILKNNQKTYFFKYVA